VLIILDIHIQPFTGFDVLRIIKNEPKYSHIPVIALTASVTNDEVTELRRSGFDGAMSKPIDIPTFPDFVRKTLTGESVWHIG
jgi:CheY-like chemotaxis protein